jgi:surfeit locus 1 family protein
VPHAVRPRTLLGLLIPLACAALFVRLGLWQLARHQERARFNAGLADRLTATPVPLDEVPRDSAALRWRRVTVTGRFRYDREQVLASRGSAGSPGVHLLTPLEREGTDTVVAVIRGWVYSADASTVDRSRWAEGETIRTLSGYLIPLPDSGVAPPGDPARPLRAVHRAALASRIGRPIAPFQLVMTSDSAARAEGVPKRLPLPTIDAGPHRSYAAQWFSFAAIAVAGGVLLFRRNRAAEARA